MAAENGAGEDRPVSIASLRSRFENLAAGNNSQVPSASRPRNILGAGVATAQGNSTSEGKGQGAKEVGGQARVEDASNDAASEAPQADVPPPAPAVGTEKPAVKPRLKPVVAPKPPSLASRPSSPAVLTAAEASGSSSRQNPAPFAVNRTTPSQPETPQAPLPNPPKPLLQPTNALSIPGQINTTSAGDADTGISPVRATLARYGSSNATGEGSSAGTGNPIAGRSHSIRRKAVPPDTAFTKPTTLSAPEGMPAPSLRRTSADGKSTVSIPLSPPADQLPQPQFLASPQSTSHLTPRSASPIPRSNSPTPITSRAPSPKPPEPSRASKPVKNTASVPAETPRPASPPLPALAAPPSLPIRKPSLPTSAPAPGAPPPIPGNRPRLAAVATAVMAAQAFSPPPPLPSRNRAETVGTRDLPPPPSRAPALPAKSATINVTRQSRGISISAARPDIQDSPTDGDDYQPPPPPTRNLQPMSHPTPPRRAETRPEVPLDADSEDDDDADGPNQTPGLTSAAKRALDDSPDTTHANRRPPKFTPDIRITGTAHVTAFAMHGRYVCTGSHVVRVYDTQLSDQPIHYVELHQTGLEFRIKDPRVSAMCFRPAAFPSEEGRYLWCGTKDGHLFELDIKTGDITDTRSAVHASSVIAIFRYKYSIMSLEEGGKLHVFTVGQRAGGTEEIAKIPQLCRTVRVSEKFNFAKLVCGRLWTSTGPASRSTTSAAAKGPTIRVYDPCSPGAMQGGKTVWATEWTGAVTCATILPLQPDTVYLGHEGGYVSVWDGEELVCQQVLKISSSDILSLEGVGERLWAGNRKGQIHAYDVSTRPWRATNLWTAHPEHSVHQLAVDPWSIEQTGRFVLWSLGKDALRAWDGLLSVDWIDCRMTARQADYSHFRDITTLVCSWNIDSARPTDLSGSEANVNFLPELLHSVDEPEIIVFGFQEVIPLTDKKLTAKTLLFGSKNKDSGSTSNKVSHAYRQWLDKLSASVRQAYPDTAYVKIHSESLVGLFTCVFVKASEKEYLRDVDVCTVKRGIGGIYGNKGAIIARLVIDDTSICFINVHLAAGQSAKAARTIDLGVIMEDKAILPVTDRLPFINGGDGTAVLDHELVILNGDLNYRIDQRRENVLSSIQAGELPYLLEHDQLRKEMLSNHAFRLRSFDEAPIHFKPTYKYNQGTSDYDSSEKRRIPAWCDRILFNKTPRLQALHYRRYEPTVSDHKPISAAFRMQVKAIDPVQIEVVRREVRAEWGKKEAEMLGDMERAYLELI